MAKKKIVPRENNTSISSKFVLGAIAMLMVGAVIGFVLGNSDKSLATMSPDNTPQVSSSASALTLNMNTLFREHAVLGALTLTSMYDGKDTSELENLLNINGSQITSQVKSIYGGDVSGKFSTLWKNHMEEYMNYSNAKKNGDEAGMQSAKNNLSQISDDLGKLLESKSISAQTITSLFNDHINGTLAIVDAHAEGNMTKEADLIKAGYDQAGKMATELSTAIVNDLPESIGQ